MKMEYLDNINEYNNNIVRLYNFSTSFSILNLFQNLFNNE